MARNLIWLYIIIGFISISIDTLAGNPVEGYTKIAVLALIVIVAILDTVEKVGNK